MESPVKIDLVDGGLGRGPEGSDGLHLKIGVAEEGDFDMVYEITSSREAAAKFGSGPLVDSIVRHFDEGGIKLFAMRPDNDQPGSIDAVTQAGTGTAVCTPAGTPTGSRDFIIEIILGGAHETATYRWSEDGGINWSSVYTTPAVDAPISLSAGVTVSFGTGTFVAGDQYSFSSHAPTASVTNFLAAIDQAKLQYDPKNKPFRFCHIVGGFDRSFWESVGSKTDDFETSRNFINFILEYPPKADAVAVATYLQEIIDEGRLFQHKRVAVVGGRIRYGDDTDFKSLAIMLCANLSRSRTNIHPGWVKEFRSKTGKEIQFWSDGLGDYISGFDSANIIAAVHYDQWEGIYIKKDHLMAPDDSDFQTIHDLRPADKARRLAYDKIMPFVNGDAGGDTSGMESLVAEIDLEISSEMEKAGEAEIGGHKTNLEFDPDTDEVTGSIDIYRKGTMEKFTIGLGYKKSE